MSARRSACRRNLKNRAADIEEGIFLLCQLAAIDQQSGLEELNCMLHCYATFFSPRIEARSSVLLSPLGPQSCITNASHGDGPSSFLMIVFLISCSESY